MSTIISPPFSPPKEKGIFHCRKICPSFTETSSCQERKDADWQGKETVKEIPEHCTKKIKKLTSHGSMCNQRKNSKIMSWLFSKWEYSIHCKVSHSESLQLYFSCDFSSGTGNLACSGVGPLISETPALSSFFPSPWSHYGLISPNYFGVGNLQEHQHSHV